jgi:hypothetical protein
MYQYGKNNTSAKNHGNSEGEQHKYQYGKK